MSWEGLVRTMRERMPWQSVGQLLLAEHDVPRSMGWDRTLNRLVENQAEYDGKLDQISACLLEHLCCGEKLATYYQVDQGAVEELRERAITLEAPDSRFKDVFPATLDPTELSDRSLNPTLTAVREFEGGTALFFSSVRTMIVRETLMPSEYPADVEEALRSYEEIIGVRRIRRQASDVVWLPSNGDLIDVLIDYPEGMYLDQAVAYETAIAAAFNAVMGQQVLTIPSNLYPVIGRMYNNSDDGIVVDLDFSTTTGSVKTEKMRRRSLCLRRESYHKGGKAALTTAIEPFKISVVWALQRSGERDSHPELSLNSNLRASGSEDPVLTNAIIRSCVDLADYAHVRERISRYLAEPTPPDDEQDDGDLAPD